METIPNPQPTVFEHALADALLAGDLPVLGVLRSQGKVARIESRDLSGVGFFLNVAVPSSAPRAEPPNFELSDVYFEAEGLPHGGGSVMFVRDGTIAMLEAYSHDGDWPEQLTEFSLRYFDGDQRNIAAVAADVRSRANLLAT
ncbi:MAG: hypothetical protein ABI837_12990 [Acidobacteriota bacterium]